jgi:hypothetical protein
MARTPSMIEGILSRVLVTNTNAVTSRHVTLVRIATTSTMDKLRTVKPEFASLDVSTHLRYPHRLNL